MSFNMGTGSQDGSFGMPQNTYRQFNAPPPNLNGAHPQIYSAIYSGVDVYEMEVNGVAVMRRRADSWLNATQILKVAGIEKGKRTKVLEKEILIGEHEKVQGGYGKYQGTWIKFEKGLDFCRQYEVEELLRPLLTYDMGQDGGVAGQGGVDTPTKEQAMAANRKRMYNAGSERQLNGQSGTFFKNISSTASHAVAAISKARFDSPGPRMRQNGGGRPPSFSRQSSSQLTVPNDNSDSGFPASQQSMQSYVSDATYTNGIDSAYATQSGPVFSQMGSQRGSQTDFQEPPRKRMRASPSNSVSQQDGAGDPFYSGAGSLPSTQPQNSQAMREPSPTEAAESFYQNSQPFSEEISPVPHAPLPYANGPQAERKRQLLMSLFMDPSQRDFSHHEAFLKLHGEELDMPIDNKAHTALHWAATLARLPLVRALIERGSSIYRVNGSGETALMRACAVTNNLDFNAFPELLELLGPTIEMRDIQGRTILHHIALTSAVKGRSGCSKYYLESLLEFVVRQGSQPSSQQQMGYPSSQQHPRVTQSMNIGRFMSEIVNAQDKRGDTPLILAARVQNRGIISQLLEVGADPLIANRAGLKPTDYGVGDPNDLQNGGGETGRMEEKAMGSVRENSGDIISGITSLLQGSEEEFKREMEAKQHVIDSIHASLRQSSSSLGQAQQQLKRLKGVKKERSERIQKIGNLRQAADEEGYTVQQLKDRYPTFDRSGVDGQGGEMYLGQPDTLFSPFQTDVSNEDIAQHIRNSAQNNLEALAGLPTVKQLRAKLAAYRENNASLQEKIAGLKTRSRDVEAKYRRVISLCTKTPEDRIDDATEGLLKAVDCEGGDVELGRIREFLGRVEGVE